MTTEPRIRPDVARNRAALVRGAIATLSEDPNASLDRIAEAAGVGRATLFRHFPSREDLLRAILGGVFDEARGITERVLTPGTEPRQALGELCRELTLLGERFRFLSAHQHEVRRLEEEMKPRRPDALIEYVRAAHASGALTLAVPPELVPHLLRGTLMAVLEAVAEGGVEAEQAPALVEGSFLRAIGEVQRPVFPSSQRA